MKELRRITWYPPQSLVNSGKHMTRMRSNDLLCDCNIKPLRDWIVRNHIVNDIKCEKPYYVHRVNITQLKDSFLKCTEPRMRVLPNHVMTHVGSDVYLRCITNSAASFAWTRNGKPFGSSHDAYQMTSGVLLLRSLTAMRGGEYTCIATTEQGTSAASSTVKLGHHPVLEGSPHSIVFVNRGEMLTLGCGASGYPPPRVTWSRDGVVLKVDDRRVFISNNRSLIVTRMLSTDAGTYTCDVRNPLGAAQKTVVVEFVHTLTPCEQVCGIGASCRTTHQCSAADKPPRCVPGNSVDNQSSDVTSKGPSSDVADNGSGGQINDVSDNEEGDVSDDGRNVGVLGNRVDVVAGEGGYGNDGGGGYVKWKDNNY